MDFWAISCDKLSTNCLFRSDNYASWLNRLSRLKRHLLEKMSIVCWLGSVPHTSGKAVNLNTCINVFPLGSLCPKWSIIWQRIRSQELTGLQCLFTCIPQQHSCPTTTPRPPCTGHRRFVRAELSSGPDVRDDSIQKGLTLKPSMELLNGGKLGAKCLHASVNMFSISILTHVREKVENRIRHFQNFGRRDFFNNGVSI